MATGTGAHRALGKVNGFVATAGCWMLLLLGCSSLFAMAGLAAGVVGVAILGAVPSRIVGLLEHDLPQALPFYVLVGVLLMRLSVGDAVFNVLARSLTWTGAGASLAALGVGAVMAPMNGSVASSSSFFSC
jgi:TRAP-type mannitol/chloroaromatic compound transport system permease large subunit